MAGGGLGDLAATLPALSVLFVFVFGAAHVSAGELLAIAGAATAVIAAGAVTVVARRFRPEAILEA